MVVQLEGPVDVVPQRTVLLLVVIANIISLIVLLSAASTSDRTSSTLDNDQQRVSDLGLRFAFKR
jgi:hypothetical protein